MRILLTVLLAFLAGCNPEPKAFDWSQYKPPDWKKYRAEDAGTLNGSAHSRNRSPAKTSVAQLGRFTFADLKTEGDSNLAFRLLGAVGRRIAYIDRHPDRWDLYSSDSDSAESIDLYTQPDALGSQYGLCGVEKYSVEFDDNGAIASVSVQHRYGVEGPIYQGPNVDWDYYYERMCAEVPASHAPSYFPAPDVFLADDASELLLILFDQTQSASDPPFPIKCRSYDGRSCQADIKAYIGSLKLNDIDELSEANCTFLVGSSDDVCFTITTGTHELGPFPKYITVKGSTHMNRYRIDAIEVMEGFTVS
jgi:hypothetical protein